MRISKEDQARQEHWLRTLTRAAMELITRGIYDPSAGEIAKEFYGREPMPQETRLVEDQLRNIIEYAAHATDESGNPRWGLSKDALTPLTHQYYDGVEVPFTHITGSGHKKRRTRIVGIRKMVPTDPDWGFIEDNTEKSPTVHSLPIGGGKKYAGLYYSEDPINDNMSRTWWTFLAASSEGQRIAVQSIMRNNGANISQERAIFDEAALARDEDRDYVPAPLRQDSLTEAALQVNLKLAKA